MNNAPQFTSFHELMTWRISEILLISSQYDAFVLQEDGPLAERIVHEYRGLNLSRPPRLTWISSATEGLASLEKRQYDLLIVMPHIGDIDCLSFCQKIKEISPDLPIYFLTANSCLLAEEGSSFSRDIFTRILLWSGNTDLLLAIVKSEEDRMNAFIDTTLADIRIILFVEDSPFYLSSLLPLLYRELVSQTLAVMDESLNEKEQMLRMRTRPKLLVAESYEEAWKMYQTYKKFMFCVISDICFAHRGKEDKEAGIHLIQAIRNENEHMPLLMLSSEPMLKTKAEAIPALFFDKNSPRLHKHITAFFQHSLGFGDFLFHNGNGIIQARAKNLRGMARILPTLSLDAFVYHAIRHDFSRWLMARYEMAIAKKIRAVILTDFSSQEEARTFLSDFIKETLHKRQKGHVIDFIHEEFDPYHDFVRIGTGSMGGKARGLAFLSHLFSASDMDLNTIFPDIAFSLPKTLVVTTEIFDQFALENKLFQALDESCRDDEIDAFFRTCTLPQALLKDLRLFLEHYTVPLAVRSSAILEDAHYRASAGAYHTVMLPNNESDSEIRLNRLSRAILLIFSSLFKEAPRQLAKNSIYRQEDEKMAVIIQQLIGSRYEDLFYPAVSGVAQSHNYYSIGKVQPADGVAHIAMGLGKMVVDGGSALRFCPKYPERMVQFSKIEDILRTAQNSFYALQMNPPTLDVEHTVQRYDLERAIHHYPLTRLASSYTMEDHRLRDSFTPGTLPVLTFSTLLKYRDIPLAEMLSHILALGEKSMGCPVEIEFALTLQEQHKPHFYLLQIRPMTISFSSSNVHILEEEKAKSWCYTDMAMGQSQETMISHILYVKHSRFDRAKTQEIAREIARFNTVMKKAGNKYLLIGPGRWGSSDRWLGIPVTWKDITEVQSIIESTVATLHAEPSHGSHFFHNLTTLGISYLVIGSSTSFLDTTWLEKKTSLEETELIRHIQLNTPARLQIDAMHSEAILSGGE